MDPVQQLKRVSNREYQTDYDIRWRWATHLAPGGFTAILWVRNEVRSLPFVLPPLLRSVEQVVMVDNGSIDGWERAETIAADLDATSRLTVLDYPFEVAHPGDAHLGTPPDSIHSSAYAHNWALSQASTRYVIDWPEDTVLTVRGEEAIQDMSWRMESFDAITELPCSSLRVRSESEAHLEPTPTETVTAWPNRRGFWFGKGKYSPIRHVPPGIPVIRMPELMCMRIVWTFDEPPFGGGEVAGEREHPTPPGGQPGMPIVAPDGANVVEVAHLLAWGAVGGQPLSQ
jgi:hypothetical protein